MKKLNTMAHACCVVLVAIIGVCTISVNTLKAAPVTFRFEAEVNSIFPGASFDSELGLSVGNVVTGQFTFEPNPGDGSDSFEINQPYEFSLEINGVELSTAAFETASLNDAGFDVDCVDFSCSSLLDILTLSGNGLSAANGAVLPNFDTESSGFQMRFSSNVDPTLLDGNFDPIPVEDVLDTAEIPSESHIWNQFLYARTLSIWLGDNQGGRFSLTATVDQFTVVPEPSSCSLTLIVVLCILIQAYRKYRTLGLNTYY